MSLSFKLSSPHEPTGDQPKAIEEICAAFSNSANKHHTLLGVTGSGKTYTMAQTIARLNRPTLVIAPNKTLAAQLFSEFNSLFPDNAVEFFISYYDYYQPEAYVPSTDTYIAKDSSINDDIDKMRHSATRSLFERRDVIIVASVSCIYGLGSPDAYAKLKLPLKRGDEIPRNELLGKLIEIQYSRNDTALKRGAFRVRGDTIHILPAHKRDEAIRIEMFGDEIDRISVVDSLTGQLIRDVDELDLYPNSHYVTDRRDKSKIVQEILADLGGRLREFRSLNKLVEYQRLEQRTMQDVEAFEQLGFCPGIENYSRYLTGLPVGHPPPTLLDYFPEDFLTIIDESHITVPQIGGMYRGDRSRKQVLVDFGFRLPAALDNRPLNFDEFSGRTHQTLYVSATPGPYELQTCAGRISEQVIRPTGLVDPQIEVRPVHNQIDDLLIQINQTAKDGGRILVTTLTKKMSEDITTYFKELGVKIRYLHSDIDSLERVQLLRELRSGDFDVLVGINLLREGLDLPEVRLVAILDADKEGFLRSRSSLIQTVGRAARNVEGRVIMYADKITDSMRACLDETERRRSKQIAYNEEHGITPQTIVKALPKDLREIYGLAKDEDGLGGSGNITMEKLKELGVSSMHELDRLIRRKQKEMRKLAADLEFEKAAAVRDEIGSLRDLLMTFGEEDS